MDLAIFHFHLNRGGVTSVIVNHLWALARTNSCIDRVLVVCGGRRDGWPAGLESELSPLQVQTAVVEALEYDSLQNLAARIEQDEQRLAAEITAVLRARHFAPSGTLLHFHNHSLGKNRATPGTIRQLVRQGYRVLLQVHDFAEDLRPAAYQRLKSAHLGPDRSSLAHQLYPQASGIHYAVLNRRDFQTLESLGVSGSRLHWLPNPVELLGELPDRTLAREKLDASLRNDRCVVLYPVRGIRRKNLGEFVLHAALFQAHATYVLSLAPKNPDERSSYERWKQLACDWRLPILWDTGGGHGLSFLENLAASDAIVTTSVAEGFGMVFLESWLAGRPLVGRDLPEITADFKTEGMRFDTLTPELRVPLDWFSRQAVTDPLQKAFTTLCRVYDKSVPPANEIANQLDALLADESVDFSMLTSDLQREVIQRVVRNTAHADCLRGRNPALIPVAAQSASRYHELIHHNASIVQAVYDPRTIGKRLARIYEKLAGSHADASITAPTHEMAVVDRFVKLERLCPIRFE